MKNNIYTSILVPAIISIAAGWVYENRWRFNQQESLKEIKAPQNFSKSYGWYFKYENNGISAEKCIGVYISSDSKGIEKLRNNKELLSLGTALCATMTCKNKCEPLLVERISAQRTAVKDEK